MENKIILITGATSGVGKATTLELAKPENQLFLIARNKQKGEELKKEILSIKPKANIELLYADLSLQKDIKNLAIDFKTKHNKLDVLINCAGLVSSERIETKEGIEQTLAVNYISHYLLSLLLLEELKNAKQGRIINVASLIPPIAKINFKDIHSKKNYSGVTAYLQSKVADVMFTYDLAEQLKNTNVTVNAVHPGIVKTNLGVETSKGVLQGFVRFCMSFIAITPQKSAERVLYLTNSINLSNVSGKYFKGGQSPVKTNSFSYNLDNRNRLSKLTKQLTDRQ
ncbi:KR domain-containing protein [Chryseotalea sanaruensis]|uniref:KR domain-containing protein n=1 Tax=Chryseotalea sanaruensis TaxID=2482724 RepID=A0A401UFN0_9BACT|nr:SDR family NAD(P)-dependent oxidoreductase [Chryseotalea sanaruensis]GCC53711.1 KR domain-containing protein [Chryseotalea sanaruensis]